MTSIYVEVDLADYLEDISNTDLVGELERRGKKIVADDHIILANRAMAEMLRSAFYRRDASRFEALLVASLDPQEVKKVAKPA